MSEAKFISIHHHPRPLVRTFTQITVALGLSAIILAFLLQIFLAFTLAPLFLGTAIFTMLLSIPLLMLSVLHPEVTVRKDGLRLRPLLGRAQSVSWTVINKLVDHPLIYEDPVIHRRLYSKNRRMREGKAVVLQSDAPLRWEYRWLGLFSGEGWTPAFGISTTTHTDYDQLVATLNDHLGTTIHSE